MNSPASRRPTRAAQRTSLILANNTPGRAILATIEISAHGTRHRPHLAARKVDGRGHHRNARNATDVYEQRDVPNVYEEHDANDATVVHDAARRHDEAVTNRRHRHPRAGAPYTTHRKPRSETTAEFDLDPPPDRLGHPRKPAGRSWAMGIRPEQIDRFSSLSGETEGEKACETRARRQRQHCPVPGAIPSGAHPAGGRAGFLGLLDHEQAALDLPRRAGGSFTPGNGARKTLRTGRLERMAAPPPAR